MEVFYVNVCGDTHAGCEDDKHAGNCQLAADGNYYPCGDASKGQFEDYRAWCRPACSRIFSLRLSVARLSCPSLSLLSCPSLSLLLARMPSHVTVCFRRTDSSCTVCALLVCRLLTRPSGPDV